ncbi:MAG: mandelate racemase/muconate lactonizing enzyme family protein [Kiritimatiellae bacterium]|nr:mandelate racemase/muconate lactonizing enzyme family protein [Kiritimatiellia bacterium]
MNRRSFIKTASLAMASAAAGCKSTSAAAGSTAKKSIAIENTGCDFQREPLIRPFGFKGGALNTLWQSAAMVQSTSGKRGIGLSTYSVLWSDAQVFVANSESGGNALMFAMTNHALNLLKGHSFTDPVALNDELFHEVFEYGKKISGRPELRPTFALNALVSVDNAIWLLYAKEHKITNFDDLIPERYKPALACRHSKAASIPLMAYSVPVDEIKSAADQGYFFMKIKIGQSGTQEEMLRKDMERLTAIHKALDSYRTPHTKSGKLPYYFDANGRYEKKTSLLRLLDHARKIGAFDQISVIEEPFDELQDIDVHDIPVRLAADESAHTDKDAVERIRMGYRAIALKAIAKTLSMTMKIANTAKKHDVPCFCADLTVNPILIEWNKNVAARLDPFPGLDGLGLLEANGHQNYKNWEAMRSRHPYPDAAWSHTRQGVFNLDSDFYDKSGGIFAALPYYEAMFK